MQDEQARPGIAGEAALAAPAIVITSVSPVRRVFRWVAQQPLGAASILVLVALWTLCLLAPVIAPYGPTEVFTGPRLVGPSSAHLLGTDQGGGDVFSQILWGGRLTLVVSVVATVLGVVLSVAMGILSGYLLGTFDLLFQRLADAFQALPGIVVLLVLGSLFKGDRNIVLIAVAVLFAPFGGRIIRGQVLAIRGEAYIDAARALGASPVRIMGMHVLPNVAPLAIVLASIYVGFNLLLIAALSFLGVFSAAFPDWGSMLNVSAQSYMVQAPWLVLAPGLAITLAVAAYNLLGDALRDTLDPRLHHA